MWYFTRGSPSRNVDLRMILRFPFHQDASTRVIFIPFVSVWAGVVLYAMFLFNWLNAQYYVAICSACFKINLVQVFFVCDALACKGFFGRREKERGKEVSSGGERVKMKKKKKRNTIRASCERREIGEHVDGFLETR